MYETASTLVVDSNFHLNDLSDTAASLLTYVRFTLEFKLIIIYLVLQIQHNFKFLEDINTLRINSLKFNNFIFLQYIKGCKSIFTSGRIIEIHAKQINNRIKTSAMFTF